MTTVSYDWVTVFHRRDGTLSVYGFRDAAGFPKGEFPTKAEAVAFAQMLPRKRSRISYSDLRDRGGAR